MTLNCDPQLGTGLQCFNLRGNAGRNILIGPGLTDFDFSLFKNNYIPRISESFNIQFRAEVFNILNHPNFAPPPTPAQHRRVHSKRRNAWVGGRVELNDDNLARNSVRAEGLLVVV